MSNNADDIVWSEPTEVPDVLSEAQRGLSVDILVYCPKANEHTVGWYNHNTDEWLFLCREANFKTFVWRYFTDKHDRYNPKKKIKP